MPSYSDPDSDLDDLLDLDVYLAQHGPKRTGATTVEAAKTPKLFRETVKPPASTRKAVAPPASTRKAVAPPASARKTSGTVKKSVRSVSPPSPPLPPLRASKPPAKGKGKGKGTALPAHFFEDLFDDEAEDASGLEEEEENSEEQENSEEEGDSQEDSSEDDGRSTRPIGKPIALLPKAGRSTISRNRDVSNSDYESDDSYDLSDSFIDDRSIDELYHSPPPKTPAKAKAKARGTSPKTPGTGRRRLVRGTEIKARAPPKVIELDSDSDSGESMQLRPPEVVELTDSESEASPPRRRKVIPESESESEASPPPRRKVVKPKSDSGSNIEDEIENLQLGNLKLSPEPEEKENHIPGAFEDAEEEEVEAESATVKEAIAIPPPQEDLEAPKYVKRLPTIPPTPYDDEDDQFWDEMAVNDWNDMHSPQKKPFDIFTTTKPVKDPAPVDLKGKFKAVAVPSDSDSTPAPITPPIPPTTGRKRAPKTPKPVDPEKERKKELKAFLAIRDQFARDFLTELDAKVTDGRVSAFYAATGGIQLIWSPTLRTTAGQAKQRMQHLRRADGTSVPGSQRYSGTIELSSRILDERQKVLDTLTHEFCHLAVMSLDGVLKGRPHGAEFQRWGARASRAFAHLGIAVTTTHAYTLNHKFRWDCTGIGCTASYGRNSKSIDPEKVRCARCHSRIVQTVPKPRAVPAGAAPNAYQVFLKANRERVKRENPGVGAVEIVKIVAAEYRLHKAAQEAKEAEVAEELGGLMGGLKV